MRTRCATTALAAILISIGGYYTSQAAPQTQPAAQSRPVLPVEQIRKGIRCPITADTQVSFYKGGAENERQGNYGHAKRLKLKGFEEYVLLKFDTAACTGMTVRRATLYLPRTEQCAPAVIAPSTVSTDWEGRRRHRQPRCPRIHPQRRLCALRVTAGYDLGQPRFEPQVGHLRRRR